MSLDGSDHAPLLWRMRGAMLRVFFVLAVGIVLLGTFALGAGALRGDWGAIALGLGLIVGGALVMVRRVGAREGA